MVSVARVTASPSVFTVGRTTDIEVTVRNEDDTAARETVRLFLFGELANSRTVTVPGDGTRTVTFDHRIVAPGTYTARSGNESTELRVRGDTASTASRRSTDDPSRTPAPGFGVGAAVSALVGFLLATVSRLRADA
jgi:hypothetical protein